MTVFDEFNEIKRKGLPQILVIFGESRELVGELKNQLLTEVNFEPTDLSHTLSLSGSTIWLEGVQLPLRNLPVAIPIDETDLVSAWQQALLQLDLDPKTDAYVLALPASLPVRYAAVLTVINALVDFVARFPNPHPLLVVAGQDFGKALGMLLRPQLQQLPLAVIDEVIVRAGDYIDIGTPLFGGSVVPVTVKSLAFPS